MKEFLLGLLIFLNLVCLIYGIFAVGKMIYEALVKYKAGRIILMIIAVLVLLGTVGIVINHIYKIGYEILHYS